MASNQAAVIEGIKSAVYVENYLDCLESMPDSLQRHFSEIRRLDAEYCGILQRMKENHYLDAITRPKVMYMQRRCRPAKKSTSKFTPGTSILNQVSSLRDELVRSASSAAPSAEVSKQQRSIVCQMHGLMQKGKAIGDAKLVEVTEIQATIERSARQLEQDSKNLSIQSAQANKKSDMVTNRRVSILEREHQRSAAAPGSATTNRAEKEKASGGAGSSDVPAQAETRESRIEKCVNAAIKRPRRQRMLEKDGEAESSLPEANLPSASASKASVAAASRRAEREKAASADASTSAKKAAVVVSNSSATSLNSLQSQASTASTASDDSPVASADRRKSAENKEKESGSSNSSSKDKDAIKAKRKRKESGRNKAAVADDVAIDPDEPTYCLCDQVSYGEMIGCDNVKCELEWFHFGCVGLTVKPKGKWFCPHCRGETSAKMKTTKS